MRTPAHWDADGPLARLLGPVGALTGALAARRMARPGARAAVPVICVGNPTAGGAGKTPTAIHLAHRLAAMGERPFLLTRGFGGTTRGPRLVDPGSDAARVGDEAPLLAAAAPTIVARDRPAGAALAASLGASVVVMDDGLQNPSLVKDLTLAVIDGAAGLGNGRCLPAGPLRAPLAAQWPLIDAALVIGEGAAGEAAAALARAAGRPVLRARLAPDPAVAARPAGARVLGFAGLGRPEKVAATLRALGAEVVDFRPFPDHHPYRAAQVAALVARARALRALPVTTAKDAARLAAAPALLADLEAAGLVVLPVALAPEDGAALDALLREGLARGRG